MTSRAGSPSILRHYSIRPKKSAAPANRLLLDAATGSNYSKGKTARICP
jgi:hypothetical protein